MRVQRCCWPGCPAQSERPFAEGWRSYAAAEGMLDGLPEHGFLCPDHKRAFKSLAVDEPPPTNSAH